MILLFIKMLPLVLMALAGYALCRRGWVDALFTRQLSLVMLNLFYPCLIVSTIVRNFTWEALLQNWMMPVGAVCILVAGWLVGLAALPLLRKRPAPARRCFHFICLMNNYSFLPILMAAALWDERAVALIILSALGSELCVWTLGVKTLTGQRLGRSALRHLVSMPMVALAAACAVVGARAALGRWGVAPAAGGALADLLGTLLETCRMVGSATIPASALICGARIAMLHPRHVVSPMMAGVCALRLVAIPAVCVAGLMCVPLAPEVRRVLVLIAVQPAAMASVTLAEAFHGDAEVAASAVLVTHVGCLVTIPLWLALTL